MPTEASIRRFIRRHVHKGSFDTFISCLPGLEDDMADELNVLLPRLRPSFRTGGLTVMATLADIYRMNLGLRMANRVLLRLGTFPAWSFPMLLTRASRIYWPAFVPDPHNVEVRISSVKSRLNMKKRVDQTLRAAVSSAFEYGNGVGPSKVSTVHVRIIKDHVWISLDTTGHHLHKRGDKLSSDIAPLRSTLASAAIERALPQTPESICDPFCGSGTILMEAFRRIRGLAPGKRRKFAFMNHPYFSEGKWRQVQRDDANTREPVELALIGGDARPDAIRATASNLEQVDRDALASVDLQVRDFRATITAATEAQPTGVIITNPPYGVRLGTAAAAHSIQAQLAGALEALPAGWRFGIFTNVPHIYRSKALLHIDREETLSLGGMPISFVQGNSRVT